VKFFFPDSQDQIDPSYDFRTEYHSPHRVRQRDDRYAHEVLRGHTYDGVLVSKAIIDGRGGGAGKYAQVHRTRLFSRGIHRFFRLERPQAAPLLAMGDCGAFTYRNEREPPYSAGEVLDFYEECEFDFGVSVDHLIFEFVGDDGRLSDSDVPEKWTQRQRITLDLAADFWRGHRKRRARFVPLGVAQAWSPRSFANAVAELQRMGYRRIALGGMVPLKTGEILTCLRAIDTVRKRDTQLHLLGISRHEHLNEFASYGVTSFDSTSPFRQAFKDDQDNYYALDGAYTAIRVPQIEGNRALQKRLGGEPLHLRALRQAEYQCLAVLARFDEAAASIDAVIEALQRYEVLLGGAGRDRSDQYRVTLEASPWKSCRCGICERDGIQVAIFRGAERNKRRGFHNLYVFRQRLDRELVAGAAPPVLSSTRLPSTVTR
jgi:hypothetical protein